MNQNIGFLPQKIHWKIFLQLADLAKRENNRKQAKYYYQLGMRPILGRKNLLVTISILNNKNHSLFQLMRLNLMLPKVGLNMLR